MFQFCEKLGSSCSLKKWGFTFTTEMDKNFALLLGFLLVLPLVHCSDADSQVGANRTTGLGPKLNPNDTDSTSGKNSGSDLVLNPNKIEKVKSNEDQVGGENKDIENGNDDKSNLGMQTERKEAQNLQQGKGGSEEESKPKDVYDKKENKEGDVTGPKDVPKEPVKKDNVLTSKPVRKEVSRGEECDLSNRCTTNDQKLIACLRVPGDDSPQLSLLIQNKGKSFLKVAIYAPKSIQLDVAEVELNEKENTKVTFSIQDEGTDSLIVLRAGNDNCTLDFRDPILRSTRKDADNSLNSTHKNLLSRRYVIAFVSFSAMLIIASLWMFIGFRGRKLLNGGYKYQKLDMDLPVSSRVNPDIDVNDGWDNSWGDNWDDEEAPQTPSMPVTPSLSAKGLAPRRLNKDGWKS